MSDVPTPCKNKFPEFPATWGPFLAFVATISAGGITAASMAHTDTRALVDGVLAGTAIIAGLIARLKNLQ